MNTNRSTWTDEDTYWRTNFRSRPYFSSENDDYSFYQPAYRYGFDASERYSGRDWNDIEPELSRGWDTYSARGQSTWQQMKHAVRDAWDRVTGHAHAHSH